MEVNEEESIEFWTLALFYTGKYYIVLYIALVYVYIYRITTMLKLVVPLKRGGL